MVRTSRSGDTFHFISSPLALMQPTLPDLLSPRRTRLCFNVRFISTHRRKGGRAMPSQVKFNVGTADDGDVGALRQMLSSLPSVETELPGEKMGAPLAELIVIALISGGFQVTTAAIAAYGQWVLERRARKAAEKARDGEDKIDLRIEGLDGSVT